MAFRWLLLILVVLLIEVYAFQAIKTLIKTKWILFFYTLFSLLAIVFIVYQFSKFDRSVGQTPQTMLTIGLFLTLLIPKLLIGFFMIIEDGFRLLAGVINYFSNYDKGSTFLAERRSFVSKMALGIAAIPFFSLIYGMTFGKYNYKVIKQKIFFDDLPEAFDGFTITHISDIHSGSFDDAQKIDYAIDLINQQNSDLLLFTGDIVNTHATEMHPWIDAFKKIKEHEFGKFSILGNHDYGEYIAWKTEKEKKTNFQAIKGLHPQIDFKLLLNENVKIKKDNHEIAIVGVENWGVNFKKVGDLNKASHDLNNKDFKILMSHDPSHWDAEINSHSKNFQLTLSGHTHGLQFGIEIPGWFKWSPAQYVYKQWAGLSEKAGKFIYVNRGFGFHAYPGRVGIMPEITVLQLKKGKNVV